MRLSYFCRISISRSKMASPRGFSVVFFNHAVFRSKYSESQHEISRAAKCGALLSYQIKSILIRSFQKWLSYFCRKNTDSTSQLKEGLAQNCANFSDRHFIGRVCQKLKSTTLSQKEKARSPFLALHHTITNGGFSNAV